MATRQTTYTGNGSTTNYSFTFEYLKQADVKVTLDSVATTAFTFANATTLAFTTAPANGVAIRIFRDTDINTLNATFYPGSAIKAEDLNDNFNQNLYIAQESGTPFLTDIEVNSLTVGRGTGDKSSNTAFGDSALKVNTTGTLNAAIGYTTLKNNTTGDNNTAIGAIAMQFNTTGRLNTANGALALVHNSTGDSNTGVGSNALQGNTTGSYNTGIGTSSGNTTTTGSNVTCIGYDAEASSATASNEITLGDTNVTSLRIPGLQSGASNGQVLTYNSSNGNITLAASVLANDAITTAKILDANVTTAKIADDAVTSAKIADGTIIAGNIASDAITTAKILDVNVTTSKIADNGVTTAKIADNGVTTAKIADNGVTAAKLAHTAVTAGSYTLTNLTVDAQGRITSAANGGTNFPTDIVVNSLTVGKGSGNVSTNTSVGVNALEANTNGGHCTAIGNDALKRSTTGNLNTAIGGHALQNVTTGGSNTAIGYSGGNNITTGSNNILLGYGADASAATVSNEITLGNASINSLRIPGLQSGASNGDVLTYNSSTGKITLAAGSGGSGSGGGSMSNVVEDTTPQLGGNLDVNAKDIISTSNGDIDLDPNGSGVVVFKGNSTKGSGQLKLNCEQNSHGIIIKGPAHSAGANYTLTLPDDDGSSSQVLSTNGSGVLSWANQPDISGKADTSSVNTSLAAKANLAGPTFTGVPAAPTAGSGTNTTQIATTAFVTAAIPSVSGKADLASPTFTGTPAAPTANSGTNTTQIATTAFVTAAVPNVSGKADLASPTFTGTPSAPTASGGTNTTQLATTAFVTAAVAGGGGGGGGAMEYISTTTISGTTAQVEFDLSSANYDFFIVKAYGCKFTAAPSNGYCVYFSFYDGTYNSGSPATNKLNYKYQRSQRDGSSLTTSSSYSQNLTLFLSWTPDTSTQFGFNAEVGGKTDSPVYITSNFIKGTSTSSGAPSIDGVAPNSSNNITYMIVKPSTTTFAAGKFLLYGVKNS